MDTIKAIRLVTFGKPSILSGKIPAIFSRSQAAPAIFRGQFQGATPVALMARLVHEQQAFGPGRVSRVMRIDLEIHWSLCQDVRIFLGKKQLRLYFLEK